VRVVALDRWPVVFGMPHPMWSTRVENSYHNAIHAADVAQAVHVFLMSSLIDTLTMRPLEVLALLVCDVAHCFLAGNRLTGFASGGWNDP